MLPPGAVRSVRRGKEHAIGARGTGQQSVALRVLAALLAVGLGFGGAALFALGSCHDSGGFCAESFSGTHVFLYAIGVVLLSLAAGGLAAAVTARRDIAAGIAATAACLLLLLVVVVETTG